jgi:hypothetical protein
MIEQGKDRYGAEYKRTPNDFHFKWLEQDNCICSICHGTGAKIEFRYITRDYSKGKKIYEELQAHERSFWICIKCLNNLRTKQSVLNERLFTEPKSCPYCGGNPVRKQLHFKPEEGEDRYKCEHHEDGSLKWSYLECDTCGRKTEAYCYEYQSTELWNKGKAMEQENEQ